MNYVMPRALHMDNGASNANFLVRLAHWIGDVRSTLIANCMSIDWTGAHPPSAVSGYAPLATRPWAMGDGRWGRC